MRNPESTARSTLWARENKDRVKAASQKKYHSLEGKLTNLITTSKYRCKTSELEHSLTTKDLLTIYEEQQGICAISGNLMEIRGKGCAANSPFSISLDRIDSDKGYTKENVWLVCTAINLMKARLTMDQFVMFCRNVSERF